MKYTVGRTGADLLLNNDNSISRSHAFLHFQLLNEGKDDEQECIELEDAGSKFGVFHNDGIATKLRIPTGKRIMLQDGDRIRFGVFQNVWTVSHQPFVSMMSALSQQQATQFEEHLRVLGGILSPSWNASCTHLTMTEVTVTVKVLHALLEQIPIVTCDYWRDLVQAARRGRTALPQSESYLPHCSKTFMQKQELDLRCRPERRRLFTGMTFIFLNRKHLETYAPIVRKAGGSCKDLNAGVQRAFMLKEKVVVIQYISATESQSSQTINTIEDFLQSHSRRIVPEYEIGLAIVHCSTEKYCNPSYKLINDLIPLSMETEVNVEPSSILVENTRPPTTCNAFSEKTVVFVPDTERNNVVNTNISASTSSTDSNIEASAALLNSDSDDELPLFGLQERVKAKEKRRKCSASKVAVAADEQDSDDELLNCAKKARIEPAVQSVRSSRSRAAKAVSNKEDKSDSKTVHVQQSATEKRAVGKRGTINNHEEKNENNDGLISPIEKPSTSKAKPTPKSRARPLPITTHQRDKRTVNMSGFLEKSQAVVGNAEVSLNKSAVTSSVNETTKRPRIAVIDDDDDDDLFCFGANSNVSQPQDSKRARFADSDEELFEFCEQSHDMGGNVVDGGAATEPPLVNGKPTRKTVQMPKPKPLPQKVNTVGWLSCALDGVNLKTDDIKVDLSTVKIEDEETKQWIDSLKGGFEVHTRSFTVAAPKQSNKCQEIAKNSSASVVNTSTSKNFKKFVKTSHPWQSRRVIATISVPTALHV